MHIVTVTRSLLIGLFWLNNMDPIGLSCSLKLSTFHLVKHNCIEYEKTRLANVFSLRLWRRTNLPTLFFRNSTNLPFFMSCCKRWKTTRNEIRKICRFTYAPMRHFLSSSKHRHGHLFWPRSKAPQLALCTYFSCILVTAGSVIINIGSVILLFPLILFITGLLPSFILVALLVLAAMTLEGIWATSSVSKVTTSVLHGSGFA